MHIELKEHELEQALESYFTGLFTKPVSVKGFDLSGMRSKDGLSAMINIEIAGETNVRKPKVESENVHPTNTEWRSEVKLTPEAQHSMDMVSALSQEDRDTRDKVLLLLSQSVSPANDESIKEALTGASENLLSVLEENAFYVDWVKSCGAVTTSIANPSENAEEVEEVEEVEEEMEKVEEVTEPVTDNSKSADTQPTETILVDSPLEDGTPSETSLEDTLKEVEPAKTKRLLFS